MKLTNEEILLFFKHNRLKLKQFKVKRLGLFGSYARGEQGEGSDIDILVEYEAGEKSLANFLGLVDFLEEAFNKEVELVTAESLSKYLRPHIEKEALYVQL